MGEMINIDVTGSALPVYLATPTGEIKGSVIVIHEAWGLSDHIKSVADRYAEIGYVAVAPNLFTELDIDNMPKNELQAIQEGLFNPASTPEELNSVQTKVRGMLTPAHSPEFSKKTLGRIEACFNYLFEHKDTNQKVATTGFCFGGSNSFSFAISEPRLKVALPFYGHAEQSVDELRKIKCPIYAFYGEKDENLISALPKLKEDMKEAGVSFEATVYPNCGHAFFNDTNKYAYNKEAAMDAWQKVQGILAKYFA
ncbi:MAG TPA: dienelactone hydrolase family protein [Candidatus Saccharimonadales bacterium]|nr:dienelactone hydrolase family protein [Candidatus Saccharimonadales bacterium]